MPIAIVIAAIVAIAGVGGYLFMQNSDEVETAAVTAEAIINYVDGTYNATATYLTPKNTEHKVAVTLTVADNVVTDASVTYDDGEAQTPNHSRFNDAYAAEVIGKDIDAIALSRVGGASLTTEAFNEALTVIKSEARS